MSSLALAAFRRWERSGLASSLREGLENELLVRRAQHRNKVSRRYIERQRRKNHPDIHEEFREVLGYDLNLDNPKTRNEKLQWRKIFDRNPLFPILADKHFGKEWLAERVDESLIVPTLHRVFSPLDLPRDIGEQDVIIKCSHSSGRILVCGPDRDVTFGMINRRFSHWLTLDYGVEREEWAYSVAERSIIVEPILRSKDGSLPLDLKFTMIGGEAAMIQFNAVSETDESGDVAHPTLTFMSPEWELSDIQRSDIPRNPENPKPAKFEEMLALSKELSRDFDHVRVDFLLIDDDYRLGEMTIYPGTGLTQFETYEIDLRLGNLWTLPSLSR